MDPLEVIQAQIEMVNTRTLKQKAGQFFQPDLEFVTSARPGILGLDAFIAGSYGIWDAMPDLTAALVDHEVSGDSATFTMLMKGTFTGEMKTADGGSIPGTGKHAEWQSHIDVTFRDGKIARWVTHVDTQDFMRQLGLG